MTCTRCGRQLKPGELICLNCGEPAISAVNPKLREKPSDVITCLVIGLFVIFGVPALLFGAYLLAIGTGYLATSRKLAGNGVPTVIVSIIPLTVFLILFAILIRVGFGKLRR